MSQQKVKLERIKRTRHRDKIKRIKSQIDDAEIFNALTNIELSEYLSDVMRSSSEIDEAALQIECLEDGPSLDLKAEDNEMDNLIFTLKTKIKSRLNTLEAGNKAATSKQNASQNPISIEVQTTDACGNIPNTWGTFDGDYAKWHSFRDRWLTAMHENKNVKVIKKFENLLAACIGKASGAVGQWDLTSENYDKAWKRLKNIYEDDYMQAQSFMQMLDKLPCMENSSSTAIRNIIDTIQKHTNGIKRYIKPQNEDYPYAVFAVINKMDSETYRAWEKQRPVLAKQAWERRKAIEGNDIDESESHPSKYIPKWPELERFLESEVTIRVHAEKRSGQKVTHQSLSEKRSRHVEESDDETNSDNVTDSDDDSKNESNFDSEGDSSSSEWSQCVLCEDSHRISECDAFKSMNLFGRKNLVIEHKLCEKCLEEMHSGQCIEEKYNRECASCRPKIKFHNILLCENAMV